MLSRKPISPEKMEAIRAKEYARQEMKRQEYLKKVSSDEYKSKQWEERLKKQQKLALKNKEKAEASNCDKSTSQSGVTATESAISLSVTPKRKGGYGLKGRNPTSEERYYLDKIGALSCICCYLMGEETFPITPHHTDGRTKKFAHTKCLPLCAHHHDVPLPASLRKQYPLMIPFHAKGSFGGKAAFEAVFGTQEELLEKVYELIGETRPWI